LVPPGAGEGGGLKLSVQVLDGPVAGPKSGPRFAIGDTVWTEPVTCDMAYLAFSRMEKNFQKSVRKSGGTLFPIFQIFLTFCPYPLNWSDIPGFTSPSTFVADKAMKTR
jgi:hypothetical protein